MSDFNDSIVKEFRENHGKVAGPFAESDILLLTTVGAKSGKSHTTPLVYSTDGDKYVIIASKAGADSDPHWYLNIKANPEVEVEVGDEKFKAKTQITDETTRKQLYNKHAERYSAFVEYQNKTTRVIPVILLEKIH
jgi:deazaflavin-dependent oxidoreductase (nitroreductase family)